MQRMGCIAAALVATTLTTAASHAGAQTRNVEQLAAEITKSVMAPRNSRPLPLAASFMTGEPGKGDVVTPDHQLGPNGWLKRGYPFLPTFFMPAPEPLAGQPEAGNGDAHYAGAFTEAQRLGLPLVFYSTQWELLLHKRPEVVNGDRLWMMRDGTLVMLPGTARESDWYEAGRRWGASPQLRRLMNMYPNPPKVVFISNNEQMKLEWGNYWADPRVLERDPACKTKVDAANAPGGLTFGEDFAARNCVRIAFQREWKRLYGKMLQGFRDALRGTPWEKQIVLVGYDAFGPLHVGRKHEWIDDSLVVMDESQRNRVASWSPWTDIWDGGIVSLYTHAWEPHINDYTKMSPQSESMNVATQLEDVRKTKPDFWFEAGVWDGWQPGRWFFQDKRKQLALAGQVASPERYAGWVRYVMWSTRAPIVREYRDYDNTITETDGHFKAVIDATSQVWNDAELASFWREGELVENTSAPHPYNLWHRGDGGRITVHRNHYLNTPSHPWQREMYGTQWNKDYGFMLPVFTMALRRGNDYLVYAHAPAGSQRAVTMELPGAFSIIGNVPIAGRFFVVRGGKVVREIDPTHRPGDLVFTNMRYEPSFLSPGNIAVMWNSRGRVDRLTFTPSYRVKQTGTPIEIRPFYSGDDGQTNFVIPKIQVPYGMGGWVEAYRGNQQVGRGWLTLGMGSDALLTNENGTPSGFALTVRDGQQTWTKLEDGRVPLGQGEATWLVLYAIGTERTKWRIDGNTEPGGPRDSVAWKLDYPIRVRIEDGKGNYWVRNADWSGNAGPGYEQINIRLTDDKGVPLPSTTWRGAIDTQRAPLPRGANLRVRIEHGSSFKDPDDTSTNGLHITNAGVVSFGDTASAAAAKVRTPTLNTKRR